MTGYVAKHRTAGEVYVIDHTDEGKAIVVLSSGELLVANLDNLRVIPDQTGDIGRWLRERAKQAERNA